MKPFCIAWSVLLAVACAPGEIIPEAPDYTSEAAWYVSDRGADVDLFYISSTETLDSKVGRKAVHFAQAADSAACPGIRSEMEGVDRILGGDLNFFSPFYRQVTMETYTDNELIESRFPLAMEAVRRAFRQYVDHLGGGRPFVLAGFSQGAEALVELLKEMPDSLQNSWPHNLSRFPELSGVSTNYNYRTPHPRCSSHSQGPSHSSGGYNP